MNRLSEWLYNNTPVFVQNQLISLYGLLWKNRRFGGRFRQELEGFREREYYTPEQWSEYQTIELRKLLTHAYKTVPYYSKIFRDAGVSLDDISKFELPDISKLPLLEKETFRKLGTTDLISSKKSKGSAFFTTSGSTGSPLKVLFSYATDQKWHAAYEARVRNWAGLSRNNSRAMIGGRRVVLSNKPPFYRFNKIENQIYFSIYHVSKENALDYYNAFKKHKPDYFVGYSSSMATLAGYFIELGLDPLKLKAVLGSSEKLTPAMRKNLSQFFGCKVYDSWSGIEACGLISEHEDGQLYISPDTAIIEVLDKDGNPVKPGEIGEVVCTGFMNYDQPLIRYRIGDLVKCSNNKSQIGLNMPIIDEVIGRTDDLILLNDGRQLSSFNRFFADLKDIIEVQVIQKELSYFMLNVVPDVNYSEDTKISILKSVKDRLGDVRVEINLVDKIQRNKNGKFRAVISEVHKNEQ